jgi:hypothetical protein
MSGFQPIPNTTDFYTFLTGVAGIDPLALPSDAPVITYAFNVAIATADLNMAAFAGNLYALAVYNLGADLVINYAPDQPGRQYFLDLRQSFGINTFVPGVISSSSNSPTSQGTLNPEFMKTLTMGDLQNMKTPYGRTYLNFAMQSGTIWGVS